MAVVRKIIKILFFQMLAGCLLIYALDKLFSVLPFINLYVGINPFTMLVSAVLGIPGVALMFLLMGI